MLFFSLFYNVEEIFQVCVADRYALVSDFDVFPLHKVNFVDSHKPGLVNPAEPGFVQVFLNTAGVHQGHYSSVCGNDTPVIAHTFHVKHFGCGNLFNAGFGFNKELVLRSVRGQNLIFLFYNRSGFFFEHPFINFVNAPDKPFK